MKLRNIFWLALLLTVSSFLFGAYDAEQKAEHIGPDFMSAVYDHYSVNLFGAKAVGLGGVGVALEGGIESSIYNPAAFRQKKWNFYLEGNVKGPSNEMNSYAKSSEPSVKIKGEKFDSPVPTFFIGIGGGIIDYLNVGLTFTVPNSIRYNVFTRELKTGDYVDRYPKMYNYQTAFSLAGHYEKFSAGINVINSHYSLLDLRVEDTFDRVIIEENVLQFQPGLFYDGDKFTVGATYKTSTEKEIKLGNIEPYYQRYDFVFPAALDLGATFMIKDNLMVAGGIEWEQTSEQYKEFDDRLIVKVGLERKGDKLDIRGGMMTLPGVYEGTFAIPQASEQPKEYIYYPLPYDYGTVSKCDQLLLAFGFTYRLPKAELNGALVKDVLQNVDTIQALLSINVKFSDIISTEVK
ncbi:MAG: hypothetical protein WCX83_02300 [Candidatus Cloacimonas sp.]|nr:hypothetical protein [Candidatus Cloacimonadota bacterium]